MPIHSEEKTDFDKIGKNIVQIKVYSSNYNAYSPWVASALSGSSGTGFIIDNNRILTNAHVVSNAKYIQAQRHNQTIWFELKIEYIAHDCDLAILKAENPKFYEGSEALELGDIPEINSQVTVIGYPMGGNKISVSRGIVSRKEHSAYAHSEIDSHLVIQVDAAINPGNSGGPAFQNNKVAGVAFQVAAKGQNIGYLIPTTVVKHFLKDIEDNKYDGYVELGIQTMNSFSSAYRKRHAIPDNLDGIIITRVLSHSSADGHLQEGDLLLEIDSLPIGRNGTIVMDQDSRVDFVEIVDNKFSGQTIQAKIWRQGKIKTLQFPALKMNDFDFMRNQYDAPFDYQIIGGMVFQAVSRDLLSYWSRYGDTNSGSQLLYRFFYFLNDGWNKNIKNDIVFYRKLAHPVNAGSDYYMNLVVETVNNKKITSLNDLKSIYTDAKEKYLVFRFIDVETPLVMKRTEAMEADISIKKLYHIKE